MNAPTSRAGKTTPRHKLSLDSTTTDRKDADPRRGRYARRFAAYYRPHIRLLIADLFCAILVSGTAIALPLSANVIISRILTPGNAQQVLGEILAIGAVMLAILAIQALAVFFVDYRGHVMGARIEAAVRQELFDHCQKLSFSFYDRQRTGQLMSRITNDSLWLGELFHHGPEDIVIGVLKYGGAMTVLFLLDVPLASIILLLTPVAIVYALHFNRRMHRALEASKQQIGAVNERVEDTLAGMRVVQSFANEAIERDRFATLNRQFLASRAEGYRGEAWFSVGMESFAELITLLVIVVGALRILAADLTVADLLTFLLCVAVLVDPVKRLANFVRLWQEGYTGFVRAMEILDIVPDIADRPNASAMPVPNGAIQFSNVTFRYGTDGPNVLDRVSLTIAPGEFVALVGPSGVGKSTLCALIPRFYDIQSGGIRIDGIDIRDVGLASLRRHVGIVQQDIYLFAGSVAENLRYGRAEATDEDVEGAARAANAHDFIIALPNGYDTDIGQRGVTLSGGQRQRLTIARAFLKDPAILIFDEATSALDNESERAVQQALATLARGRTTLVIAHRLSTVRHADRILVLDRSGIVEQGSHDDLIEREGVYADLHRVQTRI